MFLQKNEVVKNKQLTFFLFQDKVSSYDKESV